MNPILVPPVLEPDLKMGWWWMKMTCHTGLVLDYWEELGLLSWVSLFMMMSAVNWWSEDAIKIDEMGDLVNDDAVPSESFVQLMRWEMGIMSRHPCQIHGVGVPTSYCPSSPSLLSLSGGFTTIDDLRLFFLASLVHLPFCPYPLGTICHWGACWVAYSVPQTSLQFPFVLPY